jgi:hypothetical protein
MSKEGRGKGKEYEGNLSFGWREMGYTKENWRDLFSSRSTIFIPTKLREEKKKRERVLKVGPSLVFFLLSFLQFKPNTWKGKILSLPFAFLPPPPSSLLLFSPPFCQT